MDSSVLIRLLSDVPTAISIKNNVCELAIVKLKEQTPEKRWCVTYQYVDSYMNLKPAWAVMGGNLIKCLEAALAFSRSLQEGKN